MTPFEEYLSIVLYWQNNPPPEGVACHVHHIWPKSCGGPDEDWNKVRLPIKDHVRCHCLLVDLYPTGLNHRNMCFAWRYLDSLFRGCTKDEDYDRLAKEHSKAISASRKGVKFTEEHKRKIREANIRNAEATGKKISKVLKGRKISDEWRQRISASCKGRTPWNKGRKGTYRMAPWTEERRRKFKDTWAKKRQAKTV